MQNPESYIRHSLNTSSSKVTYTFSKSPRSSLARKVLNHSCYELPSTRTQRSTSLGYGKKISLIDKKCSPPPGTYNAKSQFQKIDGKNSITFKKGRSQIKFSNFLEASERLKKMPAPNQYKIRQIRYNKKGGRIGTKLPTQIDITIKKKIRQPGPGAYRHQTTDMKNSGGFFLSKYVNNRSPRIHQSSQSVLTQNRRIKTEIGPCSYQSKDGTFGQSVLSKFRNSVSGSFGKSERPGLIDKQKIKLPGFKYNRFSDFGQPCEK